jgi:hypothetical protein
MTRPESHPEALLAALREDLPTDQDEARVRRKLVAAGVAVASGVAASNLAHAAVSGAALTSGVVNGAHVSSGSAASLSGVGAAKMAGAAKVASAAKVGSLFTSAAGIGLGGKSLIAVATVAGLATYPAVSFWNQSSVESTSSVASSPTFVGQPRAVDESTAIDGVAVSGLRAAVAIEPEGETPEEHTVESTPGSKAPYVSPAGRSTRATLEGSRPRPSSAEEASRLKDETVLIERALVALRKQDAAAAKRWLSEHERLFPTGMLSRERERLRTQLQ